MTRTFAIVLGLLCAGGALAQTPPAIAPTAPPAAAAQTVAPAPKWEKEIEAFEAEDRRNPSPQGAVLFVGSSSIRIWKNVAQDFPHTKVINRGFGGSEIEDSTRYAGRIVVPYHPRQIVFFAGDNDLAGGKSPQRVFDDYKAFVARVRRDLPTTPILFISVKPSLARVKLLDQQRTVNAWVKDYSARQKNLQYVDVFTPMLGADGKPRPEMFGPDGLHMNRTGYELWRRLLTPYVH